MDGNLDFEEKLEVNKDAIVHLKGIYKLINFSCIVGFIITGIMFIFGICFFLMPFFSSRVRDKNGFDAEDDIFELFILFVFLVSIAAIFFLLYFLYRFSINIKKAVEENNSKALATSFRYLKIHYKLLLVILGLTLLFNIFSPLAFLMAQ